MSTALLSIVGTLLDKLLPDRGQAAEAKLKLLELAQQGETKELEALTDLAKGQMAVNQAEAASDGWYKGGWRPAIGYVLAFCLAYNYVINPLLTWACIIWAPTVTPPVLKLDDNMWELIFGMLGMAGWRSWERRPKKQ